MNLPALASEGRGDLNVLLLHGIGGNKSGFAPVMGRLARAGYRATAWDMPGYGGSAPVEPYDFEHLANACVEVIRHLGGPCILVGHSMGGMVAQEVAARAPEAALALVLASTSAAFGRSDGAWQAEYVRTRTAPLDAGQSMRAMAEAVVPGLLGPDASPAVSTEAMRSLGEVPEATYRQALGALVKFDRRADLAHISVPTLLMTGANDTTAPATMMQSMCARIPEAAFVEIPRAGHLLPLEAPEEFAGALIDFMMSLSPRTSHS